MPDAYVGGKYCYVDVYPENVFAGRMYKPRLSSQQDGDGDLRNCGACPQIDEELGRLFACVLISWREEAKFKWHSTSSRRRIFGHTTSFFENFKSSSKINLNYKIRHTFAHHKDLSYRKNIDKLNCILHKSKKT